MWYAIKKPEDLKYDPNKVFDEDKAAFIDYLGIRYVWNPHLFGSGLFQTAKNQPSGKKYGGKVAPKEIQSILSLKMFGKANLPQLKDQLNITDKKERDKLTAQSIAWLTLRIKAMQAGKTVPGTMINSNRQFQVGSMYFWPYDAKNKDTLEYWDKFVLDIVLKVDDKYVWAINMHYLPPNYRVILLSLLLPLAYNDTPRMRLNISETMAALIKKYPMIGPCFKCYLRSNMGRILPVENDQISLALWLPVQQFQKKTASYVWKDSLKKIRK